MYSLRETSVLPRRRQAWTEETNRARATIVVVVVGFFFILGLLAQVQRLNGLSYWTWPWRDLSLGRAVLLMSLPFLAFIWVLRQIHGELVSKRVGMLLGTLVLINFSMQIAAIAVDPRGLSLVKDIVLSRGATNFYSTALGISSVKDWLAQFHNASLGMHSRTHPPGPILYFYTLIRVFGPDSGAIVGGYLIGLTASLGVIVMYFFSGLWTPHIQSRLLACSYYAMLPALVLFFPSFDQVYPICSMLLILLWIKALNGRGWWSAAFLGIVLFVSTMLAYGLLTIGAFLVMYALWVLLRDGEDHTHAWKIIKSGAVCLGVFAALHFTLWLMTGYNAFYSWQSARVNQSINMETYFANYTRPYNLYSVLITFGPYDFLLGAGMLAFPLLLLYIRRVVRDFNKERPDLMLSVLGLATILIVDLTGLLSTETARLWLFMQPLIVVPVALELRAFAPSNRLIIFTVQWLILIVIKCKLAFMVT